MGARRPAHPDHPAAPADRRLTAGPATDGPPPAGPGRPAPWGLRGAAVGFLAGLVLATVASSVVAAATGADDGITLPVLAASFAGLWAGYAGAAVWLSRRHGTGDVFSDLGLRARPVDLVLGPAAGLASAYLIGLLYLALLETGVLDQQTFDRVSEPAERIAGVADGAGYWVIVLLVGIGAPVAEELFYRGILQPALIGRLGGLAGVAVGAVLFAVAHLNQTPLQWGALAIFGFVLGGLAWRTNRLGPAIAAHVAFNSLTLVALA